MLVQGVSPWYWDLNEMASLGYSTMVGNRTSELMSLYINIISSRYELQMSLMSLVSLRTYLSSECVHLVCVIMSVRMLTNQNRTGSLCILEYTAVSYIKHWYV